MCFDFGVDIDVDSQDSQSNEEELDKLVEDSKAKNTKKCTTWGLKKFFQVLSILSNTAKKFG